MKPKSHTEYLLVTDVENDITDNHLYVAEVELGINFKNALKMALGALKLTSYGDVGQLRTSALKKYGILSLVEVAPYSVDTGDELI